VPWNLTGLFASNSAANAWCANARAVGIRRQAAMTTKRLVRIATPRSIDGPAQSRTPQTLVRLKPDASSSALARSRRRRTRRARRGLAPFLARPRARQEMDDVEVVLVARVLVHLLGRIDLGPRDPRGPRSRPRRRIVDRELVVERIGVDAREPFGDLVGRGI